MIQNSTEKGLFDAITGSSIEKYFGFAFERLCMKNLPNILKALGIPNQQVIGFGPFFRQGPRKKKSGSSDSGFQIDILIHRKGHVLT